MFWWNCWSSEGWQGGVEGIGWEGHKRFVYLFKFLNFGILQEGLKCADCHNGCCHSNTCLNGGTCVEICDVNNKRFQCNCRPGYTGTYCGTGDNFNLNRRQQSLFSLNDSRGKRVSD